MRSAVFRASVRTFAPDLSLHPHAQKAQGRHERQVDRPLDERRERGYARRIEMEKRRHGRSRRDGPNDRPAASRLQTVRQTIVSIKTSSLEASARRASRLENGKDQRES
jgi:hypothetical protein